MSDIDQASIRAASERELVDHCIELCRARAELLSCDTPARVDACIVIDTALVLVQSVINVGVAVQEIAIDRLSPHEIPRSMVGTVGCHIAALLNHLPRRSWPALTAALTAWTEAIGVVLKESGMKERYEVRGQVRKNPDFFGVAPLSIDRDAWKRVFSS